MAVGLWGWRSVDLWLLLRLVRWGDLAGGRLESGCRAGGRRLGDGCLRLESEPQLRQFRGAGDLGWRISSQY